MKSPILSFSMVLTLSLGALSAVFAGSATWNLNPTNGDWNTAANWTPNTVPNGPADVATFDLSNTAEISLSANTEVNGVVFNPGASAFNITTARDVTFIISGAGITNNSGVTQTFAVPGVRNFNDGIVFSNNATAGSGTIFTLSGGTVTDAVGGRLQFFGTSTAGDGIFNMSGATVLGAAGSSVAFFDHSTAGNGIFTVDSGTVNGAQHGGFGFINSSSAGHGVFTLHGGAHPGAEGAYADFYGRASAGSGVFTLDGAQVKGGNGSSIRFLDSATAGDANITVNSGAVRDAEGAIVLVQWSAGNATFTVNGGSGDAGSVWLQGVPDDGAFAHMKLFGNGYLSVSNHNPPGTTIGSLEGDGRVVLGANNLAVGADNQSTLFSGVIRDKDPFGRIGGSFSKIGRGTLTLTGANLYPGGTTITDGTLVVNNTSGSGTGSGPVQVDAGTLGGKGIIAGAVTIGTGSGTGARLAPSVGSNVREATLTIQGGLIFNADATYSYTFRAQRNSARTDMVIANEITINSGATLALSGQTRGALRQGLVLTLISNTSANPISGTFSNLADGSIVTINGNNFQASYSGGDGNDLTLTVVH